MQRHVFSISRKVARRNAAASHHGGIGVRATLCLVALQIENPIAISMGAKISAKIPVATKATGLRSLRASSIDAALNSIGLLDRLLIHRWQRIRRDALRGVSAPHRVWDDIGSLVALR
ncbi:MAG TPA: hypothetical protein VK512_15910 [Xanthobacteraceae bacterium]|nr:hypothetical protein [Xanthobacteraceae bacterium]